MPKEDLEQIVKFQKAAQDIEDLPPSLRDFFILGGMVNLGGEATSTCFLLVPASREGAVPVFFSALSLSSWAWRNLVSNGGTFFSSRNSGQHLSFFDPHARQLICVNGSRHSSIPSPWHRGHYRKSMKAVYTNTKTNHLPLSRHEIPYRLAGAFASCSDTLSHSHVYALWPRRQSAPSSSTSHPPMASEIQTETRRPIEVVEIESIYAVPQPPRLQSTSRPNLAKLNPEHSR